MQPHAHPGQDRLGQELLYLLAGLFLSLHAAGMPVTLIDPHGDLAELILTQLTAQGAFRDPASYDQLLYLDISAAAASHRFLPFNFLDQPYDDHAMAQGFLLGGAGRGMRLATQELFQLPEQIRQTVLSMGTV